MGEPIDCRQAAARLQDYLKQELTPELAAEMRAHLERCRPCFAHARFEQRFLIMLESRGGKIGWPGARRPPKEILLRAEMESD